MQLKLQKSNKNLRSKAIFSEYKNHHTLSFIIYQIHIYNIILNYNHLY